jgi:hypothetical protein
VLRCITSQAPWGRFCNISSRLTASVDTRMGYNGLWKMLMRDWKFKLINLFKTLGANEKNNLHYNCPGSIGTWGSSNGTCVASHGNFASALGFSSAIRTTWTIFVSLWQVLGNFADSPRLKRAIRSKSVTIWLQSLITSVIIRPNTSFCPPSSYELKTWMFSIIVNFMF